MIIVPHNSHNAMLMHKLPQPVEQGTPAWVAGACR